MERRRYRAGEGEGGWQPVMRRQGRVGRGFSNQKIGTYTLFVDELLESTKPKGLYSLFNNFGAVKDVYISFKRRKQMRSRFGFVRYDCPVAAQMAVQKANGLWCDNIALKLKLADFEKD
ncbi:hypothetical protein ACSBR2_040526 [Camellia fascicularis]